MRHQVKTYYKQAEACYQVSGAPHAPVGTLLHYAGPLHNRPPARIAITDTAATSTLTDDLRSFLQFHTQQHTDPLFPDKTGRSTFIDYLV